MLLFEVATLATQLIDLAARGFKSLLVSDKDKRTYVTAHVAEQLNTNEMDVL